MKPTVELHATGIRPLGDLPTDEMRMTVREKAVPAEIIRDEESLPTHLPDDDGAVDLTPFFGVSAAPFPRQVQNVLQKYQTVEDEWLDIKPNGQIYLSHMRARTIFNEAFGFGGWGLVPVGDEFKVERQQKEKFGKSYEHVLLYREYRFYALGRFIRQAMGAGDYYTNNPDMNFSDAAEMCESYALNRMAKFFGIAGQCWDKAYVEEWKQKYAAKDGDGNWKKRSGARKAEPRQERKPEPRPEPADYDDAVTQPPPAPALSGNVAVIQPKNVSRAWKKGNQDSAYVYDEHDRKWTFSGSRDLALARQAIEQGTPLQVTFKRSGQYLNVESADPVGAAQ